MVYARDLWRLTLVLVKYSRVSVFLMNCYAQMNTSCFKNSGLP